MFGSIKDYLAGQLQQIRDAGLFKGERVITTPQNARVGVLNGRAGIPACQTDRNVCPTESSTSAPITTSDWPIIPR